MHDTFLILEVLLHEDKCSDNCPCKGWKCGYKYVISECHIAFFFYATVLYSIKIQTLDQSY